METQICSLVINLFGHIEIRRFLRGRVSLSKILRHFWGLIKALDVDFLSLVFYDGNWLD